VDVRKVKRMFERYIEWKIFFEITLPMIMCGGVLGIFIALIIVRKFIEWREKRYKKLADKYFSEECEENENRN
jgi:hypothetical protein